MDAIGCSRLQNLATEQLMLACWLLHLMLPCSSRPECLLAISLLPFCLNQQTLDFEEVPTSLSFNPWIIEACHLNPLNVLKGLYWNSLPGTEWLGICTQNVYLKYCSPKSGKPGKMLSEVWFIIRMNILFCLYTSSIMLNKQSGLSFITAEIKLEKRCCFPPPPLN